MPLGLPPLPPLPNPAAGIDAIDDALKKDRRVHLQTFLREEGWPAGEVKNAAAVVMAESRADVNAENQRANCGGDDNAYGPFQLCSVHKGKWGSPSDEPGFAKWAKNWKNNTRGALALWRAEGWRPWPTFTGGAYRDFYGQNPLITIDKNSLIGDVVDDVGDAVAGPIDAVAGAAGAVTDLIGTLLSKDTWFRIGKAQLGFVMVVVGSTALVFVVANKASGGQVARTTKKAAAVAITRKVPT